MPSVRKRVNIPIASTNDNVMQGDTFEFVGRPTQVQMWASCQDVDDIFVTVNFGERLMGRAMKVNLESAAGAVDLQKDQVLDEVLMPGERLTIAVQNTDAAATRNFNLFLKLTPIG